MFNQIAFCRIENLTRLFNGKFPYISWTVESNVICDEPHLFDTLLDYFDTSVALFSRVLAYRKSQTVELESAQCFASPNQPLHME